MSMSFGGLLILLFVAGVCGALGQAIAGRSRGGFVVSIVLGFIGAVVGGWLANALELPSVLSISLGDRVFPVIWSVIGSALFVALLSLPSRSQNANHG